LMPSLSVAMGRSLGFVKSMDLRYFIKPSVYLETPHGLYVLPHFALEVGVASSLFSKKRNK